MSTDPSGTMVSSSSGESGRGRWLGIRFPALRPALTRPEAEAREKRRKKEAKRHADAMKKAEKKARGSAKNNGGLCGLYNLGNTCFLNSALQCLSFALPLTEYFRRDGWLREVNDTNPLGTRGSIALAYGRILKQMWRMGQMEAIEPRHIKHTIGKYRPQFAGNQQHDAQEFLSVLLDGLHEDLNRVRSKPYIQQPDSAGRPDAVVAKEYWSNYRARDDSIIVDLFTGLLKSSLRFKTCGRVSTTFDPYTSLSLPLPKEKVKHLEITLIWQEQPREQQPQQQPHQTEPNDGTSSSTSTTASAPPAAAIEWVQRAPTKFCIEFNPDTPAPDDYSQRPTTTTTAAATHSSAPSIDASAFSAGAVALDPARLKGLAASTRVLHVKEALSRLSGVPVGRLQVARLQLSAYEIYKRRQFTLLANYATLSEFSLALQASAGVMGNKNDCYFAFEAPTRLETPTTTGAPAIGTTPAAAAVTASTTAAATDASVTPASSAPFIHDGTPTHATAAPIVPAPIVLSPSAAPVGASNLPSPAAAGVTTAAATTTTATTPAGTTTASSGVPLFFPSAGPISPPSDVASHPYAHLAFPVSYGGVDGRVRLGMKFDVKDSVAKWEVATVRDIRLLIPVQTMRDMGGAITPTAATTATTNATTIGSTSAASGGGTSSSGQASPAQGCTTTATAAMNTTTTVAGAEPNATVAAAAAASAASGAALPSSSSSSVEDPTTTTPPNVEVDEAEAEEEAEEEEPPAQGDHELTRTNQSVVVVRFQTDASDEESTSEREREREREREADADAGDLKIAARIEEALLRTTEAAAAVVVVGGGGQQDLSGNASKAPTVTTTTTTSTTMAAAAATPSTGEAAQGGADVAATNHTSATTHPSATSAAAPSSVASTSSPATAAAAAATSSSAAVGVPLLRFSASSLPQYVWQHLTSFPRRPPSSSGSGSSDGSPVVVCQAYFSFDGFSPKWNEWIAIDSPRIATYGSGLTRTHGRTAAAPGAATMANGGGSGSYPYNSSGSVGSFPPELDVDPNWIRIHLVQRLLAPVPATAATVVTTTTTTTSASANEVPSLASDAPLVPPSPSAAAATATSTSSAASVAAGNGPVTAPGSSTLSVSDDEDSHKPFDMQFYSQPMLVYVDPHRTTHEQLYERVWRKVRRFTTLMEDDEAPSEQQEAASSEPIATAAPAAAPATAAAVSSQDVPASAAALVVSPADIQVDLAAPLASSNGIAGGTPTTAATTAAAATTTTLATAAPPKAPPRLLPSAFFSHSTAPFTLRYTNPSGTQCSKCGRWNVCCLGCPIDLTAAATIDPPSVFTTAAAAAATAAAAASSSSVDGSPAAPLQLLCDTTLINPAHRRSARHFYHDMALTIDWNPAYFTRGLVDLDRMQSLDLDPSVTEFRLRRACDASAKVDLDVCMSMFTSRESLTGDASVYCSRCKKHEEATKTLELYSTPPILVLHLKRLLPNAKLYTEVNFPLRGFDPKPFLASQSEEAEAGVDGEGEPRRRRPRAKSIEEEESKADVVMDQPIFPIAPHDRALEADALEKARKLSGDASAAAASMVELEPMRIEITRATTTTTVASASPADPVVDSGERQVVDEVEEKKTIIGESSEAPTPAVPSMPSPSSNRHLVAPKPSTAAVGVLSPASGDKDAATAASSASSSSSPSPVVPARQFTPVPGGFDASAPASAEPDLYDLFAVVNHYGAVGGGHYITTALSPSTAQWYRFDDHRVTPLAAASVVSSSAYLLCYQKRGLSTTAGVDSVPIDVRGRKLDARAKRMRREADGEEATCEGCLPR